MKRRRNYIILVTTMLMASLLIIPMLGGNRVFSVTPTPEAAFFINSSGEITSYNVSVGGLDVVIPDTINGITVTAIGSGVFTHDQLTSVSIPSSVTTIGERAFQNNKLKSIIIPTGVTTIGSAAFWGNELTSVTIPGGVTTIESTTFAKNKLTSVIIPNRVTEIKTSAFEDNSLISVTIPNGVITTIGMYAFKHNKLESVTIPDSVTAIGVEAFYNNQLTEAILSKNITIIERQTFYKNKLKNIIIPDNVTKIESAAFSYNQLTSLIIPNNVTTIDGFNANQLTSVTIGNSVETIESSAFSSNQLTSVIIPDNVTSIGRDAFRNNRLRNVSLSQNLTEIEQSTFYDNRLSHVDIPEKVKTIGQWSFEQNHLVSVDIGSNVETIGYGAFLNNFLESITIPNSVVLIDESAFQDNSLTSVSIGNSTQTIGNSAFYRNQLKSIVIPDNVTTIGNSAFQNQKTKGKYIKQDNQFIYQFPNEMDYSKIKDIKSETCSFDTETGILMGDTDLKNTDITYNYIVSNKNLTAPEPMEVDLLLEEVEETTQHHVIFQDDNQSILYEGAVDTGGTASIDKNPVKDGYTFIGWDKELTNITEDTTFIAQYKKLPVTPSIDDVEHKQGEPFDPKGPIIIKDADGNIITDIEITDNPVDIDKEGTYTVTYKATDKWGGVITGNYQVTIKNSKDEIINNPDNQPNQGDSINGGLNKPSNGSSNSIIKKDSVIPKQPWISPIDKVKTGDTEKNPDPMLISMGSSLVLILVTMKKRKKREKILEVPIGEGVKVELVTPIKDIINKPKEHIEKELPTLITKPIEMNEEKTMKTSKDNKGILIAATLSAIGVLVFMKKRGK